MEDECRTDINETIAYYEQNVTSFVETTINVDVSELYKPFEELLQPGAKILDLGCGSGRDSKYFARHGYDVVAVDPSQAMCEQTKSYACVPVYKLKAEELHFSNEFDAVWACASLLHVSKNSQEKAMKLISNALKQGGVCYCSWKYGNSDLNENGRQFTNHTEQSINDLIEEVGEFDIIKIWITSDVRRDQRKQKWINLIVKKRARI